MDSGTRWIFWFLAMLPFIYIVYTLFVGLKDAVDKQPVAARSLVSNARYVTIISWSTYPIVYILPMLGPVQSSLRVFPLCAFISHAQGSSGAIAAMPFVWRGRAKAPPLGPGRALTLFCGWDNAGWEAVREPWSASRSATASRTSSPSAGSV